MPKVKQSNKYILTKYIQELQQFVTTRIDQAPILKTVVQDLTGLTKTLEMGKLLLHIVSQNSHAVQAVQKYLSHYQLLPNFYQVESIALAEAILMQPKKTIATLTLQSDTPQQYDLYRPTSEIVMGRQEACQICLPDQYFLVSGKHAEMQYLPDTTEPSLGQWQIRDLSRHGTYLNGQRLNAWHSLKTGDRLTLGYAEATAESPELIFENLADVSPPERSLYDQVANCDVLCLVIAANHPFSEVEQQIIQKAAESQITELIILVEASEVAGKLSQTTQKEIQTIAEWFKQHSLPIPIELFLVPSWSSRSSTKSKQAASIAQASLEKCFETLEGIGKHQLEETLAKRLTRQATNELNLIEFLINRQIYKLEQEIQQNELQLRQPEANQSQREIEKAIKQISDYKNECLKEFKARLDQSREDLLYEPLTYSILYKIRQAVDQLSPYLPDRRSKHLELALMLTETPQAKRKRSRSKAKQPPVVAANDFLTQVCHEELNQWALNEWQKMLTGHAGGGLQGLFQKTQHAIQMVSGIEGDLSLQPQPTLDLQPIFQDSFDQPPCKTPYTDVSLPGYLLKKIRGSLMQLMSVLIILSFVGISRRQTVQVAVSYISGSPLLLGLAFAAVCYFLKMLFDTYLNDKRTARNQEADKLKDKLRSHYYHITKTRLVPKLIQKLNQSFEAELEKVDRAIEAIKRSKPSTPEANPDQTTIKLRLHQRKDQQKLLEKSIKELQKLKAAL